MWSAIDIHCFLEFGPGKNYYYDYYELSGVGVRILFLRVICLFLSGYEIYNGLKRTSNILRFNRNSILELPLGRGNLNS